jgi:hypothetical protein
MAASVLIVCLKLAWTPSSHFAPVGGHCILLLSLVYFLYTIILLVVDKFEYVQVAGTLAATEFVLNGQAANRLQHKLALLHAAAMSDDSQIAQQRRSPKSNLREQSAADSQNQVMLGT